ncbi:MAG: undecaprenyl/decaprenyl-phosphate alpha-N-acetylglucosaminyl 1-phosphate transferase [Planctomycetales bacterium]|nr:undecaprenyl/decaprenyl-phosphate alpha-N-acetylglucosaminyl 1-phosphate transferase [bacterium]UNM09202.1 MAG: undecaprenyl/decaprenyl-phosphate alpha-N-acetylglucosaminyl 1-phosphate transferase [Planctomycetales bacterium]
MPTAVFAGLLIISMVLSALITPLVVRLCRSYDLLDMPGERKVHTSGTPRLGGVAIFTAVSVGMTLTTFGVWGELIQLSASQARMIPLIYAGLCGFFFIGFFDDLKSIPALWRLLMQLVVASFVVLQGGAVGLRIGSVFGSYVLPEWLSILVSVLWIVGVVNTFNWIDGLDGLSSGIGLICTLAFMMIAMFRPDLPNAILSLALCLVLAGAIIGFMPWNFHPAKIFIGDGGAFSLGYMLAVISLVGLYKQAALISFVLPVLILVLPIGDTLFAIGRRLLARRPITQADDKHIHHRLLARLSRDYRATMPEAEYGALRDELLRSRAHRNTVLSLYGFAAVFALIAVLVGTRA